jgi:hypothetical protein
VLHTIHVEDLTVFLQEFFGFLGVTAESAKDLWPEDSLTRRQERAARLTARLQKYGSALVRRRCTIEKLRQRTRQDHSVLERHEEHYQFLLARVVRIKKKLRRLQDRIYAARTAASTTFRISSVPVRATLPK